jgi:hypothetical protein
VSAEDLERERYARRVIGKNACDWLDIALTHLGHETDDCSDYDRAEFWEVMAVVISDERDAARSNRKEYPLAPPSQERTK